MTSLCHADVKGLCEEREALHKAETQKVHLELQQELRATEMKIIRLTKEIDSLKRVRQELFVAFETSKLLADDKKKGMAEILAKVVRTRVNNSLTKHDLAKLTLLELKKEAAEMLKLQIEAKLKK